MALVFVNKTAGGDTTDNDTGVTASISASEGEVIVVMATQTGGPPGAASATASGLTFAKIDEDAAGSRSAAILWALVGVGGFTGTITITFTGSTTPTGKAWHVFVIQGADTATPFNTSNKAKTAGGSTSAASGSLTLPTSVSGPDAVVACFAHGANEGITAGTGFSVPGSTFGGYGTPNHAIAGEAGSNGTDVSASWATSAVWRAVAVEVNAAAAAGNTGIQDRMARRIVNMSAAPSNPTKGLLYFNTTDNTLYWYNGTSWVPASGSVAFGTVVAVAEGNASADGATGQASDAGHNHGWPWQYSRYKPPVQYATTTNLPNTPSFTSTTITAGVTGTLTVDGYVTALNDRILVKDQHINPASDAAGGQHNGVYKVTTAGAVGVAYVLTREPDFNATAEVDAGTLIYTQKGSVNAGRIFEQQVGGATLGTDALLFAEAGKALTTNVRLASTANFASTYSAGTLTASATGALSIDGTAVAANDRVLLKNQTTASQNGIYRITNAGGVGVAAVMVRVDEYNSTAEIRTPLVIHVTAGTANAGFDYMQTAAAPTLDTTSLAFVKVNWDYLAAGGTTASTTYTTASDGGGPEVSVMVGPSGMVQVNIKASMLNSVAGNRNNVGILVVDGPSNSPGSTIEAAGTNARNLENRESTAEQWGASFLYTGLAPGWKTFSLRYQVQAGTGTFANRHISAIAL